MTKQPNFDRKTIDGFGEEWSRFDQSELSDQERNLIFESYFSIFPWHVLPKGAKGMDVGCGSGRWAKLVAPKVGFLYCIDPSEALNVARKNLSTDINCAFHQTTVDAIPIENSSLDFGYSLGVLHHIPDTQAGIESCVRKLKPGAPFLVYLYYAFDNKPRWFFILWRKTISTTTLPSWSKKAYTICITITIPSISWSITTLLHFFRYSLWF